MGDRRATRVTMLLLTTMAIVAFAVGCGGGSDDSGGGSGSTASAETAAETAAESKTASESDTGSESESGSEGGSQSEGESGAAPSSLSKPAFVKQANAICRFGAEKALAFEATRPNASEAETTPEVIEEALIPSFQEVFDQVSELPVPAGDEAEVEEFLTLLQQGIDELEADPGAYASIEDVEKTLKPSSEKARAYTMTSCAFAR